jgi:hypothetical protein
MALSALSCRAPEGSTAPHESASSATKESTAPAAADVDEDPGTRMRSVEEAEAFLLAARCFSTASLSLGEWPSPSVRAFNTILDSPHAADSIGRLLASPRIVPRLYGVCGLWHVARETYLPELESLSSLEGDVILVNGCVIEELSIAQVVNLLRSTRIAEQLRLSEHPAQLGPRFRDGATDLVDDDLVRHRPR